MRTILKDRTGERFTTDFGDSGTIVRYVNQHEIYVVFDGSTHMIKCEYKQLKRLDNPMRPTIYGIGYIGVGEYTGLKRSGNSLHIKYYKLWCSMMARCYGNVVNTRQTYESCIVCEEWHNYQNFAKWCENNYYEVLQEKMCLDKDILVKGNKIYSPETCVFVPNRINVLFVKNDKARGEYPLGVHKRKDTGKFTSKCCIFRDGKKGYKYLGQYLTPEDAFQVYKTFKEQHIKEVAEEYKDKIPAKLYEAMYNYKVEITD
ncbi:MAG: hypothetical protein ACLUSV_00415 [Streptococcus sp.]